MVHQEFQNVKIERENGIAWLILSRPEKRNALSPALLQDAVDAMTELEVDPETRVLVLTGAGEAYSAGMDLNEYFRALDNDPAGKLRANELARQFHYQKLRSFPKPTIAMVNGWCFGGAFSSLTSCDFAIAADDATFGLSEVNWGILPGGYVSRDVALTMGYRHGLYYALTGEPFDGRRAAEVGLINKSVPREELRHEVVSLAERLMAISPPVLRAAKEAFRVCMDLTYEQAWDYLAAKSDQLRFIDSERSRESGIAQFVDDKSYRPGLGPQPRQEAVR